MRTRNYSDFLDAVSALVGVETADLTPAELAIFNAYFNKHIKYAWQQTAWVDLCPYGEYRVANNLLTFPNTFYAPVWVGSNVVVTQQASPSPIGGDLDMTKLTGVAANSYIYQQFTPRTMASHNFCVAMRSPTSGSIQLAARRVSDGSLCTSTTVTTSTTTALQTLTFTPLDTTPHAVYIGGGSTFNSGQVVYVWQASVVDSSDIASGFLIPWYTPGLDGIDIVYAVFKTPPFGVQAPVRTGYRETPAGIQVIDTSTSVSYNSQIQASGQSPSTNPAYYLHYRKFCPNFTGADYDATSSYSTGDQIYYTAADGTANYWQCFYGAAAGNSPDSTPALWILLVIPYTIFDYIVHATFGDWLATQGQAAKSVIVKQQAEEILVREIERQELQMGQPPATVYNTHVSAIAR